MVSATVDNPTELAASLTGSDEDSINSVEFTGRKFRPQTTPDFGRLPGSSLDEIVAVLAVARIGVADPDRFIAEHGLQSAVESLREVGLLAQDSIEPSSSARGGRSNHFTTQQPNILKPTTLLMLAKPCERRVETLSLRPPSIPVDLRVDGLILCLKNSPKWLPSPSGSTGIQRVK